MDKRLLYIFIIAFCNSPFFYKCYGQTPTISSFTPSKGITGTNVIINGFNFNSIINNNIVYFGATRAVVVAATSTSIIAKVPVGATFQPISVVNSATHLTGYSNYPFHVTFPSNATIDPNNFDARVSFGTGNAPSFVATSDLDGDGKPDMLVVNDQSASISIYRNTSVRGVINSATFAPKIDITTGFLPTFADIGDLDGDGRPDVVVTNGASGTISIYKNISSPGNVNFNNRIDIVTSAFPANIKIADLDADGKPDLAVAHNSQGSILSIYKNITNWGIINANSWAPELVLKTGLGYSYVNVADLDHDNKPELMLTNAYTDSRMHVVYVFRNISNQGELSATSFETPVAYTSAPNPLVVNVADMNNDNMPDMVVSNFGDRIFAQVSSNFNVSVLLNQKNTASAFTNNSFAKHKDYNTDRIPQSSAIGDLDGDGLMDILVANYGSNTLSIFHNQSTSSQVNFRPAINLQSGLSPLRVNITDIDGDGKPDLLVVNDLDNTVSIYRNNAYAIQNISFNPINAIVYGTINVDIGAVSNNPNNPIIYTSSNPDVATVDTDGRVHTVGVGTTTITASQNATANAPPPTPKSQDLIVLPAPLIIKADNQTRAYGVTTPTLTTTITGLVNGDDIQSIGINYTTTTASDANSLPGTYPIIATGDATSANYTITYTNGLLTVSKLTQTITFDPIGDKIIGDADFTLNATASSGLPITFSSSNSDIASITDNLIHMIKVGVVNISAIQAGNEIYEPASAVIRPLKVAPVDVIVVSNTITPNGDGINDTWIILGIDYDDTAIVTIANRSGSTVFQSKGYPIPFNGTYKGKKLPAGVYYYVINFTDGRRAQSGNLTILY